MPSNPQNSSSTTSEAVYHKYPGALTQLWQKILEGYPTDLKLIWYEKLFKRHLIYSNLFTTYDLDRKGLIYLGANTGQLLWSWIFLGFSDVLAVEPQPEKFAILKHHVNLAQGILDARNEFIGPAPVPRIFPVEAAVTEQDGTVALNIMSNSNLTSVLEPNETMIHELTKDSHPGIKLASRVEVTARRLDTLIHQLPDGKPSDYNFLYMNIQGSELNALKGAPETLDHLQFILLEVNYTERYFGCPSEEAIKAFLEPFGFHPVWGHRANDSGFIGFRKA